MIEMMAGWAKSVYYFLASLKKQPGTVALLFGWSRTLGSCWKVENLLEYLFWGHELYITSAHKPGAVPASTRVARIALLCAINHAVEIGRRLPITKSNLKDHLFISDSQQWTTILVLGLVIILLLFIMLAFWSPKKYIDITNLLHYALMLRRLRTMNKNAHLWRAITKCRELFYIGDNIHHGEAFLGSRLHFDNNGDF